MSESGHAAAMRQCIADSCLQGRKNCTSPLTCSGAGPLVDQSVELWKRSRLQDVEAVEARWTEPHPTVYLAPGVVDGPSEPDEFTRSNTVLGTCARWFLGALLLWIALYVAAGYIAAASRWI